MDQVRLNQALLDAHAANDRQRLVQLYTQAADLFEADGNVDATCFYLTQAFVFALQDGDAAADALNQRLVNYGRAHRIETSELTSRKDNP